MNINLLVKTTSLKLCVLFILPLWLSHSFSQWSLFIVAYKATTKKTLISLITLTMLLPFQSEIFQFAVCRLFFQIVWIIRVLWPSWIVILSNGFRAGSMENNKIY